MVDRLISAYRAEVYDWSFSDWKTLWKENKRYVLSLFGYIALLIILLLVWYNTKLNIILIFTVLGEGISVFIIDRYTVRQYKRLLSSRQEYIKKIVSFLKSAIPDADLYNSKQVDILIQRITERVDSKIPFKTFLAGIGNFVKAIILPVVTYIAGVYSGSVGQLNIEIVASYGLVIILFLGIARLTWSGISNIIRTVLCRDYDAAVALREDLLDIKLVYFSSDEKASIQTSNNPVTS